MGQACAEGCVNFYHDNCETICHFALPIINNIIINNVVVIIIIITIVISTSVGPVSYTHLRAHETEADL
eukprot:4967683-Amphidinium_carterae.2